MSPPRLPVCNDIWGVPAQFATIVFNEMGGNDNDGVLINCDGSGAEEDEDGGEEEADDQTRDCIDGVWSVSYDKLTE